MSLFKRRQIIEKRVVPYTVSGPKGDTGAASTVPGPTGATGQDATVSIGTTTTLPAGSSATVTNTGSTSHAVFNFGIPKGDKGTDGVAGGDHSLLANLDYASSGHTGFAAALTADQNYVTDAELTVIQNTSGTNTGDVTLSGTPDYITILGQAITRSLINLATHVTGILTSVNGGTGNGFTKFTGPTTSEKTFTLPDASSTIVVQGGALGTPSSGTLTNCTFPTLNQDTTGKSAKTDALNSATTVVNVSSATAPSAGQVLTATSSTAATWQTPGGAFWTLMPGSPTRVSNTTFTVTGDVTAYVAKGMVIKWTESSTVRNAMVSIPSTFSSPNTTITIVGDTMASIDASSLKYAMIGAESFSKKFAIAGTIGATGTDNANAVYAEEPYRVLGADMQVGTAGTTNSTTVNIVNGTGTVTLVSPTLGSTVAATTTPQAPASSALSLALNDRIKVDVTAIQTTAAIDLYAQLYVWPTRLNNLT